MKIGQSLPVLVLLGIFLIMPMILTVFAGVHGRYISCSLYHNATLDEWWPQNSWKFPNITIEEFREFPFPDGLTQVDGEFVNATPDEIQLGDILVFRTLSHPPVIAHRVIKMWTVNWTHNWTDIIAGVAYPRSENISRQHYSTVGDNWFQQPYERKIAGKQVVGKIVPATGTTLFARLGAQVICTRENSDALATLH